jgi:hypothetical protein
MDRLIEVVNNTLTLNDVNIYFENCNIKSRITKLEQFERYKDQYCTARYFINIQDQEETVTNTFRNAYPNADHMYNNIMTHSYGMLGITYVPKKIKSMDK